MPEVLVPLFGMKLGESSQDAQHLTFVEVTNWLIGRAAGQLIQLAAVWCAEGCPGVGLLIGRATSSSVLHCFLA
jgi:hypothetical protein